MSDFLPPTTIRRAIDPSGCIGSFWDDRWRCVVGHSYFRAPQEWATRSSLLQCAIFAGHTDRTIHPLDNTGIEDRSLAEQQSAVEERLQKNSFGYSSQLINQHTRLLYLSWTTTEQCYPQQALSTLTTNRLGYVPPRATHLITGIYYGVDIILILQLSADLDMNRIEGELKECQKAAREQREDFLKLDFIEENSDTRKIQIRVCSNVPALNAMTYLSHIRPRIYELRKQNNVIHPIFYFLRSLGDNLRVKRDWSWLKVETFDNRQLGKPSDDFRPLLPRMNPAAQTPGNDIDPKFPEKSEPAPTEEFEPAPTEKSEPAPTQEFEPAPTEEPEPARTENSEPAPTEEPEPAPTEKFESAPTEKSEPAPTEEHKPARTEKSEPAPKEEPSIPSSVRPGQSNGLTAHDPSPLDTEPTSSNSGKRPTEPSSEPDDTYPQVHRKKSRLEVEPINLLLFGASGVGKSTFINALANYLNFASLEDAEAGQPIVLIPVSFIITSGYEFDEQIITFGDQDPTRNENFNDRGHSVTQQCRSHIFDLPEKNKRIRIIDTPGFGDTRGIDQDEINIQHITDYLRQYQPIHAICFLLKPNESRLNILFRTCFNQLFSIIGESEYRKLIFCFTNARSTFYAPGDTGPSLRKMLTSLDAKVEVKMEKKNTFCFDNEAFRYLVARQNGVEFTEDDQQEYANSWTMSVKTANELLDYILQELS